MKYHLTLIGTGHSGDESPNAIEHRVMKLLSQLVNHGHELEGVTLQVDNADYPLTVNGAEVKPAVAKGAKTDPAVVTLQSLSDQLKRFEKKFDAAVKGERASDEELEEGLRETGNLPPEKPKRTRTPKSDPKKNEAGGAGAPIPQTPGNTNTPQDEGSKGPPEGAAPEGKTEAPPEGGSGGDEGTGSQSGDDQTGDNSESGDGDDD